MRPQTVGQLSNRGFKTQSSFQPRNSEVWSFYNARKTADASEGGGERSNKRITSNLLAFNNVGAFQEPEEGGRRRLTPMCQLAADRERDQRVNNRIMAGRGRNIQK